ncbi:serine/threonine-protein kinase [Actinokineospora globicatena]|uniref:serine/threonine-protein kinase n=1 Tax=Actinokineospora globicatena TaxID=103729 RepID=UPI0020A3469B|nr:protein kinase [Actinokineospora globicatena]MCP2302887.1 Serine/threonine protein kinase [Actinokineospora globicatena]GLW78730.1 hypothetical protein Aglo01_32120 [Actinokineospora globicatena]GLW84602.1 hypothetical protein Aglo02_22420 [Actinokineospora globicatena]
MSAPRGGPPTEVDPGRGPGAPRGGPPTEVDPGRAPLDSGVPTEVDPGRTRPVGEPRVLPPGLAARFRVEQDLNEPTMSGGQGDVYHVVRRSDGTHWALKVHRPGWRPDDGVVDLLTRHCPEHVVGYAETGVDDDRFYEVMAYLTSGTLLRMRRSHPGGIAPDVLTELVRQLTAGLVGIHAAGVVHRDIKPANLLLSSGEPLRVAIADFGIAMHLPAGETFTDDRRIGTLPYTPPEFVAGRVLPAFDWWSLGVCVRELATGQPLFADVKEPGVVRSRLVERPIDTDVIADDGIRLLCAGLLTIDPARRWGAEQVTAWLSGDRPAVSTAAAPPRNVPRAAHPYVFAGAEYWERTELAADLVQDWGMSLSVLCESDSRPRDALLAWLATFPDNGVRVPPPPRRAPADVRLLHLIRAVDPTFPPWYRRCNIAPGPLAQLARDGYGDVVPSPDIVAELWDHDLLRLLATGTAGADGAGGLGLPEVQARWRREQEQLAAHAHAVQDVDARRAAEGFLRTHRGRALSVALLAATATEADRRRIRRELDEWAREFDLDWFTRLVRDPNYQWVAMVLTQHAEVESARLAEQERARAAHEDWLRRTEGLRDWSRRHNRPQALSHAAAGVAAIAAVLFALVGLGDVVDVATDAQVVDSWVGVVAALLLGLVSESALAWDCGGRFHPAYSLLGAGRVALGRLARNLVARRIAGPALLAALAGLGALTIFAPVVTPFLVAFLLLPWTVQRYLAWRAQDRREREILARPRADRPSPNR